MKYLGIERKLLESKAAIHTANIASAETTLYIQENEDTLETDRLANMTLQTVEFKDQNLVLSVINVSDQGEEIGEVVPLI